MPKMDGFELLDTVQEKYPHITRVVLSGHTDVSLILRIVNEKNIDRYLTKPWDIDVLKWIIRQCVELHDLRQELHTLRKQLTTDG